MAERGRPRQVQLVLETCQEEIDDKIQVLISGPIQQQVEREADRFIVVLQHNARRLGLLVIGVGRLVRGRFLAGGESLKSARRLETSRRLETPRRLETFI